MNTQSLLSHLDHLEQTSLLFILVTWFLNFVHLLFNFLTFVSWMGIVFCIFIFRRQISTILNKKKMYSAIWKKEADVHLSKTGRNIFFLFSWYWSVFKVISFDVSFIQIG
jgi:hypothetical protein